jgi:hypothetical protein
VLDGPPVDQEYLTQLLEWSVENNKKIKTIIFLQDINNVTSNIGALSQFLGLYVPFRLPSQAELIELLKFRMLSAGNLEPQSVFSEDDLRELAASHQQLHFRVSGCSGRAFGRQKVPKRENLTPKVPLLTPFFLEENLLFLA